MTLRAIIGFEDFIPKAVTFGNFNLGDPIQGTPFTLMTSPTVGFRSTLQYAGGWMKVVNETAGSGQNKLHGVTATLGPVVPVSATAVITVGVRYLETLNTPAGSMWFSVPGATLASQCLECFPKTVFPGSVPTASQEYYLEATIDFPAGVVHRWIDGAAIADIAIPAAISTAAGLGNLQLSIGSPILQSMTTAQTPSFWFKDGYILDKSVDNLYSSRLGPQVITVEHPNTVTTSAWTTSAASLLAALTTPITDAASSLTPVVTTDVALSPGTLKFAAPSLAGKINGIMLTVSAQRASGASSGINTSVISGASESTVVPLSLSSSLTFGQKAYLGSASPDGGAWTPAKLAAANFKLQPT